MLGLWTKQEQETKQKQIEDLDAKVKRLDEESLLQQRDIKSLHKQLEDLKLSHEKVLALYDDIKLVDKVKDRIDELQKNFSTVQEKIKSDIWIDLTREAENLMKTVSEQSVLEKAVKNIAKPVTESKKKRKKSDKL